MTPIGPITPEERINSLDTLRGFALLGILPANVLVFGMYFAAGNDPTVAGGATGLNLASWALFRILIEGKMRCLFSMVFGASMILLTSRVEARSGATAADIYYRRNLWLLLFGLAHAFLLFWGDILYPYALCALILFPFRKLPGATAADIYYRRSAPRPERSAGSCWLRRPSRRGTASCPRSGCETAPNWPGLSQSPHLPLPDRCPPRNTCRRRGRSPAESPAAQTRAACPTS